MAAKRKRKTPIPKQTAIQAVVMSETEGASSIEIGKRLNLPSSTVRSILAGDSPKWAALRQDSAYVTYSQETRRQLQTAYSELAKASLEQAERKLPEASYAAAMVGGGIAVDKLLKLSEGTMPAAAFTVEQAIELDAIAAALAASLVPA